VTPRVSRATLGEYLRSQEAPVDAAVDRDPNEFAQELFTGLPQRYDTLAEVLSFGQNGRWRHEMVSHVADPPPSSILDVATGTAGVALELVRRTPARVTGIDLTPAMLRRGQERVERERATGRVRLVVGQAEQLPFPDATFDALTFTYLLRYVADPAATLRELTRVLKPGGSIASLEFAVPANLFWRAWWWGYTRLVLPAAGYLTGGRDWYGVGRFLGPNISAHYRRYPVSWTVHAWREAGLADVMVRSMSLGGGLVMWARKPAR
jgi:demethylmenaquinone methyltransferase/2-methoxy-6-polyprenyl-1,4-benzoquinol methylase